MNNKHSFLLKVLTLCLAATMLLAVAAPALADYTPVGVTKDYPFSKYLVMDKDMPIPLEVFIFDVTAGDPENATASTPAIMPGVIVGVGENARPSIPAMQFTPTSSDVIVHETHDTADVLTGAALTADQKYLEISKNVDFTGVTFDKPGVYRYVVTETSPIWNQGVTPDENTSRYMDVYVKDTEDPTTPALEVASVIFHNVDAGINTDSDGIGTKNTGFTNRYAAYQVTLNKTVTGNQGNRDQYFKFTVTIAGGVAETQYTVELNDGEFGAPDAGDTNANKTLLTMPIETSDSVSCNYYLKHGQTITIRGLTAGNTYTITEFPNANEGYTTSNTVDAAASTGTGASTTSTGTVTVADDDAVVFTNHRNGTVPTGILLDVAPYALIVAFAGVALLLLGKRKAATR